MRQFDEVLHLMHCVKIYFSNKLIVFWQLSTTTKESITNKFCKELTTEHDFNVLQNKNTLYTSNARKALQL